MKPYIGGLDIYGCDDTSTGSLGPVRFAYRVLFLQEGTLTSPLRRLSKANLYEAKVLTSPHLASYLR